LYDIVELAEVGLVLDLLISFECTKYPGSITVTSNDARKAYLYQFLQFL